MSSYGDHSPGNEEADFNVPRNGEMYWQYDERRQNRADAFNRGGKVLEKLYIEYENRRGREGKR